MLFNKNNFVYTLFEVQENYIKFPKSFFKLVYYKCLFLQYLHHFNIKFALLNHQFSCFHLIARDCCKSLGIKYAYWHPGFLPGTMCFDINGQMAESDFYRNDISKPIQISKDYQYIAKKYVQEYRANKLQRPGKTVYNNVIIINKMKEIISNFNKVILFIGANDFRTGIRPVAYKNSNLHSETFKNSKKLFDLISTQINSDTLIIYKPHPNLVLHNEDYILTENKLVLNRVMLSDILPHVDCCISIISSGVYEALLHSKPTLLLGNLPGINQGIFFQKSCINSKNISGILQELIETDFSHYQHNFNNFIGFCFSEYFFSYGKYSSNLTKNNLCSSVNELFKKLKLY